MVENYFDKAAAHTGISPDLIRFYKKPDTSLKFNLSLKKSNTLLMKVMEPFKQFLPIDANTKPISYPPREEQDFQNISTQMKFKLLHVWWPLNAH